MILATPRLLVPAEMTLLQSLAKRFRAMPPSRYFEAGAPVKQATIQQSITGTVRPTISLAPLEILPIGRTRANCRGCITCAFCDLSANRQPILNFLTDLRGPHAAFGSVLTRENIGGASAPSRPSKATTAVTDCGPADHRSQRPRQRHDGVLADG